MSPYAPFDSTAGFNSIPFSFQDSTSLHSEALPDNADLAMLALQFRRPLNPSSPPSDLPPPTLSNASAASIPSNTSSAVGSPYSTHAQAVSGQDSWRVDNQVFEVGPTIINNDGYDAVFGGVDLDSELTLRAQGKVGEDFVDPSLIQPTSNLYPDGPLAYPAHAMYRAPPPFEMHSTAVSPNLSHCEPAPPNYAINHLSPDMSSQMFYNNYQHAPYLHRRASVSSLNSRQSHPSPMSGSASIDAEGQDKGRCPHPGCGRIFKDLKAHMLTHQSERPEKCPILNCEYNQKGFARKYDKNRHTLTHYKGTMVCGFCPGSGSSVEKSFNRADVFKRHLTSVHGVEQTPPNSRKRSPNGSNKKASSYCQDATGKCSTCSATFSSAQDFYEHLDDCVLRVVQQEEPSEAINQQHLGDMAADDAVKETMERHMLTGTDETTVPPADDEEDEVEDDDDDDDDDDPSYNGRTGKSMVKSSKATSVSRAVANGGISKSARSTRKGLTLSKGGVPLVGKSRRKRKHYPVSWGVSADKMKMRKRVLCVYDGERRLWKDDMMLNNEFEVRMNLADGKSYVTDLDVETLKRADALHGATPEEKGPWNQEEAQGFSLEELMS
ncbi:hypothetical protein EPUS_00874 [Endocarpon pusillum Z07020]|uniref:C2H2-type domain-containing protein n=1 Tax=Endocarpon pusillum (strain Z07020 / HMAS-L-300199) TaxID=1263415 RepID=U1GNY4_ENDPU|nr:uncharacterized protein EPUS_00874 [Endocarpon pusillum Z07020]ERF73621.1 hypothetical protein EPUS_00874 [Endocarpon pusillum Z07020]